MMKKNRQILCAMVKTIQIGQVEIRSFLDLSMHANMRSILQSQLQEYHSMETEAYTIAMQRGWELSELEPAKRFLIDKITRTKLNGRNTDSKIADMLILENTKAMIQGLKNLHQLDGPDHQLQILSQKLLDCETAHIRQMQTFL